MCDTNNPLVQWLLCQWSWDLECLFSAGFESKKMINKLYAFQNDDLFTPEKYLKINDNTAGKYLISINIPDDTYDPYYLCTPIVINCYKKRSDCDKNDSTMVWQAKL